MSKIHEALKKAQQERAANMPAGSPALTEELDPSLALRNPPVGVFPEPSAVAPPSTREKVSENFVRFEQLIKNCAKPVWQPDPHAIVFSQSNVSKSGAEQFRTLRSRLSQMRETMPLKTIQVTSAVSGEGKTFVTTNLAQAIARQRDRRVLLIDADLRRSRLHMALGAPLFPGLSEYLRGEASDVTVIQHGQEGNLCLIPGGNAVTDPSELLSNGRLKALLERFAPVFDWIIIDSPPCLPVADSLLLADQCDGVLLVIRAGSTPLALAQKARHELKGKKVIGVVLNAVDDAHSYGGYYYGSYGPEGATKS